MGRLGAWLNAQTGWRRAALTWVVFCPPAVTFGSLVWAGSYLLHPGCEQLAGARFAQQCEPRLGTGFLGVAALSVLAAVPFALLAAVMQRRWAAKKPGKALLSWPRIAAVWCLSAALLLTTFINQQPDGRGTYYFVASCVLIALAAVFLLLEMRRLPTRGNPPRVRGSGNGN